MTTNTDFATPSTRKPRRAWAALVTLPVTAALLVGAAPAASASSFRLQATEGSWSTCDDGICTVYFSPEGTQRLYETMRQVDDDHETQDARCGAVSFLSNFIPIPVVKGAKWVKGAVGIAAGEGAEAACGGLVVEAWPEQMRAAIITASSNQQCLTMRYDEHGEDANYNVSDSPCFTAPSF